MQRRVPAQELRGSDATLLEVQLQNLVRRPLGQLAPENLMDLLALNEVDERPKSLARALEQFAERASKEVADLPTGGAWAAFLDEIADIDGARIPTTFRGWMAREAERTDRDGGRIREVLSRWEQVDPEPFAIGARKAAVQRGAVAAPSPASEAPGRRTRSDNVPRRTESAPRRAAPAAGDPDRTRAIEALCLERLAAVSDKGLAEQVLVVGVRHRAKEKGYGDVTPADVTAALRHLRDTDRARTTAGRWMAIRRW